MKKIILSLVAATMFITSVSAVDFAFGARGNVNFGLGTTLEGAGKDYLNVIESTKTLLLRSGGVSSKTKKGGNIGGGFGLYSNLGLVDLGPAKLGLQPELDFNFNNGYHIDFNATVSNRLGSTSMGIDANVFTHTLDIPLLVTMSFPLGKSFELGAGIGPQLSIPLKADAEISANTNGTSQTQLMSDSLTVKGNVNFGMVFDVNGKILFGSKKNVGLVFDARYNLDFTTTKFKESLGGYSTTEELFTRRFLELGLGLEYRL